MLFNSWTYGIFLLVTVCAYWLLPANRTRELLLIVGGAVFYAYYYPPHVFLIVGLTIGVFALGHVAVRFAPRWQRRLLVAGATGCLGLLGYYKYEGLFAATAASMGFVTHLAPMLGRHAPLAISFFTFEYIHYLLEVRRGRIRDAGFLEFLLFILFFPTLICGPIKRFPAFAPQIGRVRFDGGQIFEGLERILVGLAKKIVIADTVAGWIAPIWAHPDLAGTGRLWLGAYGYAVQIYFDFAGYSDIAIGSAQLFGYHVPENFDAPYLKRNIGEFWRSWHMSLTSWIRDYVYIPLGGNRVGPWRANVNRLLAMTLCGLWHGAAWHFAFWGLYHGIGLVLHRLYGDVRRWLQPRWSPSTGRLAHAFGVIATFHFVCVGWVLFVTDLPTASRVIARLFLMR